MVKEGIKSDVEFSWDRLRTEEELGDFIARKLEKFDVLEAEICFE
jgi:hypothetical protein